jgi:hypothetical protein
MTGSIRHRLWLRLLPGVAAVAVYVVVALVLAATIPESRWPSIGDALYSSRQATTRIVVTVLVAVIAAATGPLLAVQRDGGHASDLVAPGVVALAIAGIVVGAARVWATRRLTPPSP